MAVPILITPVVLEKTSQVFWSRVNWGAHGRCWLYSGRGLDGNGYPQLRALRDGAWVHIRGHRWVYYCFTGKWPTELVLHRCGNRTCVNPCHLYEGSPADNARDMVRHGRSATGDKCIFRRRPEFVPRGERHRKAKLTDEAVQIIREEWAGGQSTAALARQFGVGDQTIRRVARGAFWRHVPLADRDMPKGVLRGEGHPRAKVSADQVQEVRAMRRDGFTLREIAETVGMSISGVHSILSGQTWGHLR